MKILMLLVIFPWNGFSECVEEKVLLGAQIPRRENVFVQINNQFLKANKNLDLIPDKKYIVQHLDENHQKDGLDYNDKYLDYYGNHRLKLFLKEISKRVDENSYIIKKIGVSVRFRDLLVIMPKKVQKDKDTILMFVRHHGNEGTANWIFEGFLDSYLKSPALLEKYQLIVYPMINPDGVAKRTRFNANKRDLNRQWINKVDEVKIVSDHLDSLGINIKNVHMLLDMHSHKNKDIFYRVDENYISKAYYDKQSEFIDILGNYDIWQNGNFVISNGKEGMARKFFADSYRLNSLTHETLKNIPRGGKNPRTIGTLKEQGAHLVKTLLDYLDWPFLDGPHK